MQIFFVHVFAHFLAVFDDFLVILNYILTLFFNFSASKRKISPVKNDYPLRKRSIWRSQYFAIAIVMADTSLPSGKGIGWMKRVESLARHLFCAIGC